MSRGCSRGSLYVNYALFVNDVRPNGAGSRNSRGLKLPDNVAPFSRIIMRATAHARTRNHHQPLPPLTFGAIRNLFL